MWANPVGNTPGAHRRHGYSLGRFFVGSLYFLAGITQAFVFKPRNVNQPDCRKVPAGTSVVSAFSPEKWQGDNQPTILVKKPGLDESFPGLPPYTPNHTAKKAAADLRSVSFSYKQSCHIFLIDSLMEYLSSLGEKPVLLVISSVVCCLRDDGCDQSPWDIVQDVMTKYQLILNAYQLVEEGAHTSLPNYKGSKVTSNEVREVMKKIDDDLRNSRFFNFIRLYQVLKAYEITYDLSVDPYTLLGILQKYDVFLNDFDQIGKQLKGDDGDLTASDKKEVERLYKVTVELLLDTLLPYAKEVEKALKVMQA